MKTIKEINGVISCLKPAKVREFSFPDKKELEEKFKEIIKNRIEHCENELYSHLDEAVLIGPIVYWDGGHFSKPVYDNLQRAYKQPMSSWDRMTWQQIIRQLYSMNHTEESRRLFFAATEILLVKDTPYETL